MSDANSFQSSARILVIDDHHDDLDIVASTLRGDGHEVLKARSGTDAIEEVRRQSPDLVLVDFLLPDLNGIEVARRIKGIVDAPFIPVILLAPRDGTPGNLAASQAGVDCYVVRPIDFAELYAHVRSLLRIKRLSDELDADGPEWEP